MAAFANGVTLNPMGRGLEKRLYLRITAGPQRGRYVHQLVAEAKLGRPLRPDEDVDHENGNTLDNAPDNLTVLAKPLHALRGNARRKRAYDAQLSERRKTWRTAHAD